MFSYFGSMKHCKIIINLHLNTEGVDYHAPPCNFTFPAGSYVDCMDLTVINDLTAEFIETLSIAVGGVVIDGRSVPLGNRVRTDVGEAIIHITDNDGKYEYFRFFFFI